MNILVLSPYVAWPLDHGGRMRTWHLLRALAREHDVTNLAVARLPKHRDDAQELAKIGITVRPCLVPERDISTPARRLGKWLGIAVGRSSLPGRWREGGFAAMVREAAGRRPDLVVIETLWMDVYRPLLGGAPYVASTHNVESDALRDAARYEPGLRRALAERDATLLRRHEVAFFAEAATVVAVSEADAARMRELAPAARVSIVENGVETASIPFRPRADAAGPLLFVGSFDYPANVDAARILANDLMPRVRGRSGGAGLVLAGRNPPQEVRALAREDVEVTGTVADLSPLYERAGVVVVPLRFGGGTRIKILEALAYGRPVVTTTAGAAGLAVTHEQHVLVADDPAAMAAAVTRLGSEPALVSRLAVNGRKLVEERHAWPGLETRWVELFRGLARPAK